MLLPRVEGPRCTPAWNSHGAIESAGASAANEAVPLDAIVTYFVVCELRIATADDLLPPAVALTGVASTETKRAGCQPNFRFGHCKSLCVDHLDIIRTYSNWQSQRDVVVGRQFNPVAAQGWAFAREPSDP